MLYALRVQQVRMLNLLNGQKTTYIDPNIVILAISLRNIAKPCQSTSLVELYKQFLGALASLVLTIETHSLTHSLTD